MKWKRSDVILMIVVVLSVATLFSWWLLSPPSWDLDNSRFLWEVEPTGVWYKRYIFEVWSDPSDLYMHGGEWKAILEPGTASTPSHGSRPIPDIFYPDEIATDNAKTTSRGNWTDAQLRNFLNGLEQNKVWNTNETILFTMPKDQPYYTLIARTGINSGYPLDRPAPWNAIVHQVHIYGLANPGMQAIAGYLQTTECGVELDALTKKLQER